MFVASTRYASKAATSVTALPADACLPGFFQETTACKCKWNIYICPLELGTQKFIQHNSYRLNASKNANLLL